MRFPYIGQAGFRTYCEAWVALIYSKTVAGKLHLLKVFYGVQEDTQISQRMSFCQQLHMIIAALFVGCKSLSWVLKTMLDIAACVTNVIR